MLRYEPGIESLHGFAGAHEMRRIEPLGAAERQSRAVQREGIVAANRVEEPRRGAAPEVVLDVDLEPRHGRMPVQHFLVMTEAQPDPGFARDRARCRGIHPLQDAVVLPPWILEQSPAGSSTKDLVSRAWVAWPAQECAPSAQSFFAAALMP